MRVVCWGRGTSFAKAREAGCEVAESREAFFAESDIISLHLSLRLETRGIITAADLARMKPTALLVNVSRGALIGDQVLADALKKGRPGFAAVDVNEEEPVRADNPLIHLDNCMCVPHLGYNARDTFERYLDGVFDHVVAFAAGKPVNVVNPLALQN